MPYTQTTTKTASIGSDAYVTRFADTGEEKIEVAPSIPAAKSGTLTTRTDDDTGILTMTSGHGITTGQKLDVFWAGGSRRNMTVGTVATNSVPIDLGSGDNLPAASTAITAMVPVSFSVASFNGDAVLGFAVYSPVAGYVVICQNGSTNTAPYHLDAGEGKSFSFSAGDTNPIAATDITVLKFSHGDSSQAREMRFAAIVDA